MIAQRQRVGGFSLIEVLVALLLLTLGIMGFAGLFITSMQTIGDAGARSQAVSLADDYVDRIRANRDAAEQYAISGDRDFDCDDEFDPTQQSNFVSSERQDWINSVACLLPDPGAQVSVDDAGNVFQLTVTLNWRANTSDDAESQSVEIQTAL